MGKFNDLTGKTFGRLYVIERVGKDKHGHATWLCECSCKEHNRVIVLGDALVRGSTKSCGCLVHETGRKYKVKKPNRYKIEESVCYLFDDDDNCCTIDAEDYNKVKAYYWYKNQKGYWKAWDNIINKSLNLQRFITNCKDTAKVVDHISGNKSDNRKINLRICSTRENSWNTNFSSNNKTGCQGVIPYNHNSKYHWKVHFNQKENGKIKGHYFGLFETFDEAVYARKLIEEAVRGEFVRQENFPEIILSDEKKKQVEEKIFKKLKEKKLI